MIVKTLMLMSIYLVIGLVAYWFTKNDKTPKD
jgi:hypothetical protein